MSKKLTPKASASIGFLFTLPFVITNFIIALRIDPFYSFLGSSPAIRNNPFFPLLLLLLFPIGAYITIRPMLQKSNGKRKIYLVNSILAAIILLIFLVLFIALGEDIYRCDVLKIPNCD